MNKLKEEIQVSSSLSANNNKSDLTMHPERQHWGRFP
jgi:hypothetical protein